MSHSLLSGPSTNWATTMQAAHVAEIIANSVALTADNGIGTSSVLDLNAASTVNLTSSGGGASIANAAL